MQMDMSGFVPVFNNLMQIADKTEELCEKAVYVGAGLVADEVKKGLEALPVQENSKGLPPFGTPDKPLSGVTSTQKEDLIASLGIAPHKNEDGSVSTSVGFDGYGRYHTANYPNGLPNQLLMRAVESGTRFRKKIPTVRPAVNRARRKAEQAMKQTIINELKKEN